MRYKDTHFSRIARRKGKKYRPEPLKNDFDLLRLTLRQSRPMAFISSRDTILLEFFSTHRAVVAGNPFPTSSPSVYYFRCKDKLFSRNARKKRHKIFKPLLRLLE